MLDRLRRNFRHGIRIEEICGNLKLYDCRFKFLDFFICIWVRDGCKTFIKLAINDNFEDQDLLQRSTIITFLLLSTANAAFEQGFCLYLVSYYFIFRRSHRRCSVRKGVLKKFAKFIGKHLCQSLFFNNIAGLRPATLLKKRFSHRRFPVNFEKFLRTSFLQNTCGRLLVIYIQ